MSHFGVLVCVPSSVGTKGMGEFLNDRMDRWDENREVSLYRDYEEGSPTEYWWVRSLKRDIEGLRRMEIDGLEATRARLVRQFAAEASAWDRESPERKAAKEIADFEWSRAHDLGESPSWAAVAAAYNAKWHTLEPGAPDPVPGNVPDDEVCRERMHVDEEGRAYTWSTRNPEAKWDYWRIGGRWREYFIAREYSPFLVRTSKDWDSPDTRSDGRIWCDGGEIGALDFDAMRDVEAARRLAQYDQWRQIVGAHGNPPAWADLTGLVDLKELSIEEARHRYNGHPAIKAARDADIAGWSEGPEEMYGTTREEFERLARLATVPSYALVTLDGEWVAPGEMGWWGMSSDGPGEREGYRIAVNKYIDSLSPKTWLVVLDCHI
jgi:hypothetical protein